MINFSYFEADSSAEKSTSVLLFERSWRTKGDGGFYAHGFLTFVRNDNRCLFIQQTMYLGIDPGVRKLGYALIDDDLKIIDAGILLQDKKSPTREDQFNRANQILEFFENLLKKYSVEKVAMEKLFFTEYNQNNAEFVYAIRGALMMLFLRKNISVLELTPIELKKFITGNGKADKMLVQKTIRRFYQLQDIPEYNDAADALGFAYLAKIRK